MPPTLSPHIRHRLHINSLTVVVAGCVATGGCYQHATWKEDFSRSASAQRPQSVRLELRDRTIVHLGSARIVGDSIVGNGDRRQRAAFALRDVRELRERRFSALRTAGLVIGSAFTAAALFVAFVVYSLSTEPT